MAVVVCGPPPDRDARVARPKLRRRSLGDGTGRLRRNPAFGRGAADAVHAMEEFERLLPDADFVALTCPLTAETENLIDAEALSRMKPTAHLVNVARGRVVDQAAPIEALAACRIAGVLRQLGCTLFHSPSRPRTSRSQSRMRF